MALATTCPQCKTSFRVVPDQLKLRRGFVRCGRCHNVFAGIDHLRYVGDAQLRAQAGEADAGRTLGPVTDAVVETMADAGLEPSPDVAQEPAPDTTLERPVATIEPEPESAPPPGPEPASPPEPEAANPPEPEAASPHPPDSPLETGPHPAHEDARDAAAEDESDGTSEGEPHAPFFDAGATGLDEAQHREAPDDDVEWIVVGPPAHGEPALDIAAEAASAEVATEVATDAAPSADAPAPEAPARDPAQAPPPYVERFGASAFDADEVGADESAIDYFSTKRSRGFADRRALALGLLALALAVALAMQWVIAERSAIAVRAPIVAPLLGTALAPFGLRIEPPRELDALTIESFELQASGIPDVLEMRALLRNDADHAVRWPSMQLTLTDHASRVLVRRSLHPADYLPEAQDARLQGIPARTEWPLRLALEADELQPAGYDFRVRLFYP